MSPLAIYLFLAVLAGFFLYRFLSPGKSPVGRKLGLNFRKRVGKENWVQVYETASWEEARQIQEHLQDEGFECILYEQGKKDIHGNPLRGIGVAVPKTSVGLAQKIISRLPV